jgi:hypothetical protein
MNTKKLIISGLVAFSLAAVAARAQVLPGSDVGGANNPGDLVLGFRNTTSGAQSSDVVFDIGQYTAYEGLAPGTYTIAGFNSADLVAAYGSDATNGAFGTATKWAVFGGSGNEGLGSGDGALWTTAITSATLTTGSYVSQNSLSSAFDTFVNTKLASLGGAGGDTAVLNPKAYTNLSPGSSYGGQFSASVESTAAGSTKLNLWELVPGHSAVDLGYFTLNGSSLTFTVFSAIPEPSTYAAILGLATLGIVAVRRRKQAQVAI